MIAVLDTKPNTLRDRVGDFGRTVVRCDNQLAGLLGVLDTHTTGGLRNRSDALRCAGFEEFLDTRQTVRNVFACHTTGVEGTHRELRARFTDRLCCDDADRFADFNRTVGGE